MPRTIDRGDVRTRDSTARCVYAVVPTGTEAPSAEGLDENEFAVVNHDDIAAVVEWVRTDEPRGKRAELVRHGAVLAALAAQGPVIPVRFGTALHDDREVVEEFLAPNSRRLRATLTQLAAKSQFNLRARYDEDAVLGELVTAEPAIAELRQETRNRPEDETYGARIRLGELVARALDAKRVVDGDAVLHAMAPHAAAYHVRDSDGALDHLIDVAFLVDDAQCAEFEAAAEEMAAAMAGRATLRLVGPLAPYDFVAEE